jgi:16S rRNA (uracil1498-N3)-methyltransferase
VNGKGSLAKGKITELSKRSAHIEIEEIEHREPGKKIILAQGLCRQNSLEYIIEKGTELGASEFWLFPAQYSEKKLFSDHQKQRLKNLTISALKQCGRLYLPMVYEKPPLQKLKDVPGQLFFGDVRQNAPLLSTTTSQEITFFVGPEKGFTDQEVQFLENTLKAQGVKLHENILRVDTAALASIYLTYLL